MSHNTYQKISKKIGRGIVVHKSLCFYNPQEVYEGIKKNKTIQDWQKFMIKQYHPKKKKILLIYPCTTIKPYDKSRSYVQLYKHLNNLKKNKDEIQLMTISEPFGLVPEECYQNFHWYDCPGLFEWWCKKHGQKFDFDYLDKSIEILADNVGIFLKKVTTKKYYDKIICYVRTYTSNLQQKPDHTHRRILELAAKKYKIDLEILPKRNEVRQLTKTRGNFAWDMYGVAHPLMLKKLVKRLEKL